jgi:hypothetical protein
LVSKAQAARKYELSAGVIDRWIWKYRDGTLTERSSSEEKALRAENERLKAKIGELTMENDLLKKLEAYAQQRRKENTSVISLFNFSSSLIRCALSFSLAAIIFSRDVAIGSSFFLYRFFKNG